METISRTCRWVRRRLPLLAGGDLVGVERRRVERHLVACPGCRSRRSASERSLAVLQEMATLDPRGISLESRENAPSLWPALARQIREARHRSEPTVMGSWVQAWDVPPLARWAGLALAASLVLGSAWLWSQGPVNPTPKSPLPSIARVTTPSDAASVAVPEDPATLLADNDRILRKLNEVGLAALQRSRRSSALPDGDQARDFPPLKPGVDPFDPPLTLRFDYDLDYGIPSGSALNTQRAY